MKNWKTKNGYEIVQILSGRSKAYLIMKGKLKVLIDTGTASAYGKIIDNFDALGLSVNKVTHLILTHTHFDHCQCARRIKDDSLCEVVASCHAENWIKTGFTELSEGTNFFSRSVLALGRLIGKSKFGYQPFEADILIHGDYHLKNTNNQIRIIETPGHSEDSISVLVDNEVALVGDLMFGVFRNAVFPPFANNTGKMIRSWGRLLNTDCGVFLPGHGSEIKRDLLKKHYDKNVQMFN